MKEEELFEECLERAQVLLFFGVESSADFVSGLENVRKSRNVKAFLSLLHDSLNGRFERFLGVIKVQLAANVPDLVPVKNILLELEAKRNSGSFAVQLFEARDAHWKFPARELSEGEVVSIGCASASELEEVKSILSSWARAEHNFENPFTKRKVSFKFKGRLWIAGSVLLGRAAMKGVYLRNGKKLELYGPKPVDFEKLSDVDLGIEMDERWIDEYVPPHLLTVGAKEAIAAKKSALSARFLWSAPLDKSAVKKNFFIRPNDRFFAFGYALLRLFEMLEGSRIHGVRLGEPPKERPVHVLFFAQNDDVRKLYEQVRCVLVREP